MFTMGRGLPVLALCLMFVTSAMSRRLVSTNSASRGSGFWSVKGADFIDAQGNKVYFSGVIWAGFETPEACVHGLWNRSIDSHLDQMQELGFNMIRLPFAGDTLRQGQEPTVLFADLDIFGTNPDIKGKTSLEVMDLVIEGCGKRGMKVILDYHRMHLTVNSEPGLWFDDTAPESTWIDNWKLLATRYKGNPTVIGADLFNEVHDNVTFPIGAPFWEPPMTDPGLEKYNFRSASKRAIEAIHSIEPNWICFMEGMWQNYWWGGDLEKVFEAPITEPAGKVAFSTHEYGPVVAVLDWFNHPSFPANLIPKRSQKWGFVMEKKLAPVWIGEFGSFYPEKKDGEARIDFLERTTFENMIGYIGNLDASWTIAFWNPNSKDTGGILTGDWTTVHQRKMDALKPIMRPGFNVK